MRVGLLDSRRSLRLVGAVKGGECQRGAPPKAPLRALSSPTLSSRAARHQPQPTGELRGVEGAADGELHERSHLHPTCPTMGLRSLPTIRCVVTGAGAEVRPTTTQRPMKPVLVV